MRNRIPAFEGLRNEQFKYVRYFDHGNHEFLHDLKNDPDELVNLADDPKHADTLKAMRERTTKRVAEYGGPLDPLKGEVHRLHRPASRGIGRRHREARRRRFRPAVQWQEPERLGQVIRSTGPSKKRRSPA